VQNEYENRSRLPMCFHCQFNFFLSRPWAPNTGSVSASLLQQCQLMPSKRKSGCRCQGVLCRDRCSRLADQCKSHQVCLSPPGTLFQCSPGKPYTLKGTTSVSCCVNGIVGILNLKATNFFDSCISESERHCMRL